LGIVLLEKLTDGLQEIDLLRLLLLLVMKFERLLHECVEFFEDLVAYDEAFIIDELVQVLQHLCQLLGPLFRVHPLPEGGCLQDPKVG